MGIKSNGRGEARRGTPYAKKRVNVTHYARVLAHDKIIPRHPLSDALVCRAKLCNHDEIKVPHESGGPRVFKVDLNAEVSQYNNIIHHVWTGTKNQPNRVRNEPNTRLLRCCTNSELRFDADGKRVPRLPRTEEDPCTHILAVQRAMGWVEIVEYAKVYKEPRVESQLQPAPASLDTSTLFNDASQRQPRNIPVPEFTDRLPDPTVLIQRGADGSLTFRAPDGSTSLEAVRLLFGAQDARPPAPLAAPHEFLDAEFVAMLLYKADKDGLAREEIVQQCAARFRPGHRFDMKTSLQFLETHHAEIQQHLSTLFHRDLAVDQQRLREGGVVRVLAAK